MLLMADRDVGGAAEVLTHILTSAEYARWLQVPS